LRRRPAAKADKPVPKIIKVLGSGTAVLAGEMAIEKSTVQNWRLAL